MPDLTIEGHPRAVETVNGKQLLRFSTWAANLGVGPVELRGGQINGNVQDVDQRVYDSDGVSFTDRRVGTFIYHPEHAHIHFEDYADYYLREVNEDESVGSILRASEKVSFCLLDSQKASPPHPGTPPGPRYVQCEDFQGISVGWIDVYDFTLPGQNINVSGVSSGTYWLELVVDRTDRLLESNENNNVWRMKVPVATSSAPEIHLLGNGQAIANNDTTPSAADHTDFGYADVRNGTVVRTFTIQNTGSGTLSLTGVPKVKIVGSGDFSVVAMPASPVIATGTVTFQIAYDPSGLNSNAEIVITNNDADEGSYRFAIRGNTDADGDGLPDDWEALYALNDPAGDEDADGASNRDEFIAGTSPRDAQSLFRITETRRNGTAFEVTWTSVAGRRYQLYSRPDLPSEQENAAGWELVGEREGTGQLLTAPVPGTGNNAAFFRVTTGF